MSQTSPNSPSGNRKSGAVKRIMQELKELQEHQSEEYTAHPLEDNLFEWHFTIRGPADSEFHGGIYHGRIMLPSDYPFQPPNLMMLTPSGRFEIGKKICLSISGYHPEFWQPSWSIRTVLVALIAFMPSDPQGAIGSLNYSPDERRILARESVSWTCPKCGSSNSTCFTPVEPSLQIAASNCDTTAAATPAPLDHVHRDEKVQEHPSSSVVEVLVNRRQSTRSDLMWTSLIFALLAAILAILIKKAIST